MLWRALRYSAVYMRVEVRQFSYPPLCIGITITNSVPTITLHIITSNYFLRLWIWIRISGPISSQSTWTNCKNNQMLHRSICIRLNKKSSYAKRRFRPWRTNKFVLIPLKSGHSDEPIYPGHAPKRPVFYISWSEPEHLPRSVEYL